MDDPYEMFKKVGTLLSIPLMLGVSPVVGCAIGFGIDKLFGTRPIFTIVLLLLGFAAGVRETWKLIRRSS